MTSNIMLDLETAGVGPNAAILSIGACFFYPETMEIGPDFYCLVSLEDNVKVGRVIEPGSFKWWLEQSDDARLELVTTGKVHQNLKDALLFFNQWALRHAMRDDIQVWANSPAFDCVKMQTAAEQTGAPLPWNFWNERDYRTMRKSLPYVELEFTDVQHNALDDAKYQAQYLMRGLQYADNVDI